MHSTLIEDQKLFGKIKQHFAQPEIYYDPTIEIIENFVDNIVTDVVYMDTEGSGLDFAGSEMSLIQLGSFTSDKRFITLVIPLIRLKFEPKIYRLLQKVLNSNSILKVGHNLKYDRKMLIGLQYQWPHLYEKYGEIRMDHIYDTLMAEMVLNAGLGKRAGLDACLERRFDLKMSKETRRGFIGTPADYFPMFVSDEDRRKKFLDIDLKDSSRFHCVGYVRDKRGQPTEQPVAVTRSYVQEQHELIMYSAGDIVTLPFLRQSQLKEMPKKNASTTVDYENQCVKVTAELEINGFLIDLERWATVTHKYEADLLETVKALYTYALEAFPNINGVQTSLFDLFAVQTSDETEVTEDDELSLEELAEFLGGNPIQMSIKNYLDVKVQNKKLFAPHNKLKLLNHFGVFPEDDDGKATTSKTILYKHKDEHAVVELMINFAKYSKFLTSFLWVIPQKYTNPITGKVHPEYMQLRVSFVNGVSSGTDSGRFSSRNFNLQQAPGIKLYRNCFVADEGYGILTIDQGSFEVRMNANASHDPNLCAFFNNPQEPVEHEGQTILVDDFHGFSALKVFGKSKGIYDLYQDYLDYQANNYTGHISEELQDVIDYGKKYPIPNAQRLLEKIEIERHDAANDEISPPLPWRKKSKIASFAMFYGSKAPGLSRQLSITLDEAEEVVELYKNDDAYGVLFRHLEAVGKKAQKQFFVEDGTWGRRRYFERTSDRKLLSGYARASYNFVPQCNNANAIKLAMIRIYALREYGVSLKGTVHDEIIIQVPLDKMDYWSERISKIMVDAAEEVLPGPVSYVCGVAKGDSWTK